MLPQNTHIILYTGGLVKTKKMTTVINSDLKYKYNNPFAFVILTLVFFSLAFNPIYNLSITVILVVIDLGGTILIFHKSPKSRDYCIDIHIGSLLYSFVIFLNHFESFRIY